MNLFPYPTLCNVLYWPKITLVYVQLKKKCIFNLKFLQTLLFLSLCFNICVRFIYLIKIMSVQIIMKWQK